MASSNLDLVSSKYSWKKTHSEKSKRKQRKRIRKRPVRFGNATLSTLDGYLYTYDYEDEDKNRCHEEDEFHEVRLNPVGSSSYDSMSYEHNEAIICEKIVAMVGVPPEQIPIDLWNFVRAHIDYITHVRILTSLPNESLTNQNILDGQLNENESIVNQLRELNMNHTCLKVNDTEQIEFRNKSNVEITSNSTSYIVLFQLESKDAVDEFIFDLNGKPFTFLQEDVVCHAYRILPPLSLIVDEQASGKDSCSRVSLMGPFFDLCTANLSHDMSANSCDVLKCGKKNTVNYSNQNLNKNHSKFSSSSSSSKSNTNLIENQNCAVCLDSLQNPIFNNTCTNIKKKSNNISNGALVNQPIFTTICNHTFHMECLLRWQDSPCPVCRYDHAGLNETLSKCHVCGTTENTFVCLICGVVSCGRAAISQEHSRQHPFHSHAHQHYESTLHAYALSIDTQHVWDFAGDGFVHRLVNTEHANDYTVSGGSKIVEINDPFHVTQGERSRQPGLSDAQQDELVHRKLEGFADEYNKLLKDQMNKQRCYYEERIEEIRDEALQKKRSKKNKKEVGTSSELIWALKQERNQLEQRLMTLKAKSQKVNQDIEFISQMCEGLESNKPAMERQIRIAQMEKEEAKNIAQKCLPPLEEKVKKLMLQLDMGSEGSDKNIARKKKSLL